MNNLKNISLIFEENPISRAYLNYFRIKNHSQNQIVYLIKKSILPKIITKNMNFTRENEYPLKFLKDQNVVKLIAKIEEFFLLERGFLVSMYRYQNIFDFKNVIYTENNKINSSENIIFFNKLKNLNFLNSGKVIFKDIFNSKKNFYHIHPGYLPLIKGADASLHSINNYNELGASLFKMDRGIDSGEIIYREKIKLVNFKFERLLNYNYKDLYRIWYSFIDPAIRVWLLDKCFQKQINLDKFIFTENEQANYFSFFKKENLDELFGDIFI